MQVTLYSTTKIVDVNGVPARVWEGTSAKGVPVYAYITRIAAPVGLDHEEFIKDLQDCAAPSAVVADLPLRLIL